MVVSLGVGGCVQPGAPPLQFSIGQVHGVDRDKVFERAESALVNVGYRIDKRDPVDGILITEPIRMVGDGVVPRRRASISRPAVLREVAEVRVTQAAEGVKVRCRIVMQELATEAYRMFMSQRAVSDSPGATPIELEAATTAEQNTVWRTVHHDKRKERRVLSAILADRS